MADKPEVKLTNQTFTEAGGVQAHPDLEMITLVSYEQHASAPGYEEGEITEGFKNNVQMEGGTYAFKVEYFPEKGRMQGTAYGPKK